MGFHQMTHTIILNEVIETVLGIMVLIPLGTQIPANVWEKKICLAYITE